MEVTRGHEGSILQLHTQDALDKVVDWYNSKLKPDKVVRVPGVNAILKTDELNVIITAAGNGTNILLKQDVER